jgi:tetratricopeptide (TPR) repeat protein
MASNRIENLIGAGKWKAAQRAIEKQLAQEPNDHWLWSRLSGVKYEQRDYEGALAAAEQALKIVPDCPLGLWSYAGALDMLGRTGEAGRVCVQLVRRGLAELNDPDEDAEQCWEGADWTRGLVVDCIFRIAGWLAKIGQRRKAAEWYQHFLGLLDFGMKGIYSRADALARLKKLKLPPGKNAAHDVMARIRELEEVKG